MGTPMILCVSHVALCTGSGRDKQELQKPDRIYPGEVENSFTGQAGYTGFDRRDLGTSYSPPVKQKTINSKI